MENNRSTQRRKGDQAAEKKLEIVFAFLCVLPFSHGDFALMDVVSASDKGKRL
ncbi:MAG: hypothetical protein R6V08_03300 [Desulfuromonadales bacterium]